MTIWNNAPQGSDEWLAARKGAITGSQFKVCRDKTTKGELSAKAKLYAMNVARERVGGKAPEVYANSAMRTGTEQEPFARMAYEEQTGAIVEEVGFAHTDDGKFGASVDGLVGDDGMVEIKTMVSSDTLFTAMVDGEIDEYRDQCVGAMWLLCLKWCDLCLWAPDLPSSQLTIIRIERDEDEIQKLEDDLLVFERVVTQYEDKLRAKLAGKGDIFEQPPAPKAPSCFVPIVPTAPAVATPRAVIEVADF